MIELKGKYNTCKIFTDDFDKSTVGQLTALLNQESINKSDNQTRQQEIAASIVAKADKSRITQCNACQCGQNMSP